MKHGSESVQCNTRCNSHGAKPMEFWSPRDSEKVAHGKFREGGGKVGSAMGRPTASSGKGGIKWGQPWVGPRQDS